MWTGQGVLIYILSLVVISFLFLWDTRKNRVSVMMFHGVSQWPEKYPIPALTTYSPLFEAFLKILKSMGYQSISLEELHSFKLNKKKLPGKSIVFTFDDGNLDNWVFAAPLLDKYGFKGTLFCSTDFIDPSGKVRPNLKDVWEGKSKLNELVTLGYCSYEELKLLDENGLLDIQGHAQSHTWYFSSPKVVGFCNGNEQPAWLEWNAAPDKKPFSMARRKESSLKGNPVFEHKQSLGLERRYFPSSEGMEVFRQAMSSGNETLRLEVVQEIFNQHPGRFETEIETQDRYTAELKTSKETIEKQLNKKIDFFAWPVGKYNEETLKIAKNLYKATTFSGRINLDNQDPFTIYRISGVCGKGNRFEQFSKLWLKVLQLEKNRGNLFVLPLMYSLLVLYRIFDKEGFSNNSKASGF